MLLGRLEDSALIRSDCMIMKRRNAMSEQLTQHKRLRLVKFLISSKCHRAHLGSESQPTGRLVLHIDVNLKDTCTLWSVSESHSDSWLTLLFSHSLSLPDITVIRVVKTGHEIPLKVMRKPSHWNESECKTVSFHRDPVYYCTSNSDPDSSTCSSHSFAEVFITLCVLA